MSLFSSEVDESKFVIDQQFVSTLPNIMGYEIKEQRGLFVDYSRRINPERCLRNVIQKAYDAGCKAFVNLRISASAEQTVVYGDDVIIERR